MDGNGLKFEKNCPIFSSFDAACSKNPQELLWSGFSDKTHEFDIFVVVYRSILFMIKASK